jgi:hypothetical protein
MTTFQKVVLVGVVVALGMGVYEVRALGGSRERLATLEREAAKLSVHEHAARAERDAARDRLTAFQAETARSATASAPGRGDPVIAELVSRASRLKSSFESDPRLKIPEMALLQEADWLDVARLRPLDSEADLRASLAHIRGMAKSRFTRSLTQALSAYVRAHEGRMPSTAQDLRSHITEPVDPVALGAMLARYEMPAQGLVTNVPDKAVLILESQAAMIDRDYDNRVRVTRSVSTRDTDPFKFNTVTNSDPGPLAPGPVTYLR